ncbi:MAG: thioredoxin domain-containing protein [Anaerolineales bacterium]|jgi:protein-disulfide isomerase|nr:thioredoxin domain-containing protein [Anaerolineales bacterium]
MSKRQEIRDKRRKQQQTQRIVIGSIILLGALLVSLALILPSLNRDSSLAVNLKARPQADFNQMGDPNAPIAIMEFSDYKCGHCGAFVLETEPQLVEEYIKTGKVYFTYRSMGAWSPESLLAIEASYCAGDENKFWEFHDLVFLNQTATFNNGLMNQFATQLDLDEAAFNACLKSGKYRERANQDGVDGSAKGVQGTPTFFITYQVNGEERTRVLGGNYPFSGFQKEIEAALEEIGQ